MRNGLILFAALAVGLLFGVYLSISRSLPPTEAIAFFSPPVATKIYDDNGEPISEFFIERRELTTIDRIPEALRQGFISIEDKSFYKHWGVDLRGVGRAFVQNLIHMRNVQGFSTITMQLARNMFLTQEKTLIRKLKEIVLAIRLERAYTKDEILEKYLNQINFGRGRYGVATAARYYFAKEVSDLSLPECALMVALAKSPEVYSPYRHPERAVARRNLVLRLMLQEKKISEAEYTRACEESLTVVEHRAQKAVGAFFIEEIRRNLELKYGPEFLYRSGANLYTTMNVRMQTIAEEVLNKHLAQIEKQYQFKNPKSKFDTMTIDDSISTMPYLEGAVVILDHRTGEVKALVGGRDFEQSKWNRATQATRQTGSSFKTFVFAAAIDNGFTAADIVLDLPIVLEIPGQDSIYRPANYDHRFLGSITMRRALALSRNLTAVRLIRTIGPDLVVKYAHSLGVQSPLLPVVSLALGACEARLIDMTSAFGTIANLGERIDPTMITRITDNNGTLIEKTTHEPRSVLSPQTSYIMTSMMRAVVDGGTGYEVRKYYRRPAAGKTGTTDNYSDAWFVGFTPRYTIGVWVGFDDNQKIFRGATGGIVAAPIWGEIMAKIDTLPPTDFAMPANLVWRQICQKTGLLATQFCPSVVDEVFLAGSEPTQTCDLHSFGTGIGVDDEFEKIDRSALDGY